MGWKYWEKELAENVDDLQEVEYLIKSVKEAKC